MTSGCLEHQHHSESGPGQEAWDIYQVIRHAYAWKRYPEGGWTVDFNEPMKTGHEPLPEITIEDD